MDLARKKYDEPNLYCVSDNLFEYSTNPKENVELNYSSKSPLRYPGGKSRGVSFITKFIPRTDTILSPFLGGGSIELFLAAQGVTILGYDIFQPLVDFWQCLLTSKDELVSLVRNFYPLSKKDFYSLQANQLNINSKIERAAVFYVLNRSSFSGSTLSGGMSPEHPRFTESSIKRLEEFNNPFINVNKSDFKESLLQNEDVFAYLDPPYLTGNHLYGNKGDAHKDFDHIELANILRNRERWILSYNNCPEISELYKEFEFIIPNWKYGMGNNKESNEVLILSNDISNLCNYNY